MIVIPSEMIWRLLTKGNQVTPRSVENSVLVTPEQLSEAPSATVTALLYQPFAPSGFAGEIVAVVTGATFSTLRLAVATLPAVTATTHEYRTSAPSTAFIRYCPGVKSTAP